MSRNRKYFSPRSGRHSLAHRGSGGEAVPPLVSAGGAPHSLSGTRNTGYGIRLLLALLLLAPAPLFGQAQNTCLDCHGSLDDNLKVTSDQIAQDIHIQKGLTCASCHGGDPTSMEAMDPKKGFKGHIARAKIPELCASCHAKG